MRGGHRRLRRAIAAVVALTSAASVLGFVHASPAAAGGGRVISDQGLDDVLAAAAGVLAADADDCGLSTNRLAAMTLAVVWPEVGSDTTVAPSPMTLSRWDVSAGLFAFRSPSTSFKKAFWHPGIGMWQEDSAGLGAPYTAAERISTGTSSKVAARAIKNGFCSTGTMAGAWNPWHACDAAVATDSPCRKVYEEIYNGSSLQNLARTTSVSRFGGMSSRSCGIEGLSAPITCYYVNPANAQGQDWWTVPAAGASPISAPFYVYKSGGREHRVWLTDDTGYSITIHASRELGKNARNSSATGGTTWESKALLCDLTALRGPCLPEPIGGYRLTSRSVNGTYFPIAGDFDGDGRDDVFWYGDGAKADSSWFGTAASSFVTVSQKVSGHYFPVAGDFNGDGRDDILWYGQGSAPDSVWLGRSNRTFTPLAETVNGTYFPIAGDFDGDGHGDVLWYGPGDNHDALWRGRTGTSWYTSKLTVKGTYLPISGRFDADSRDDIVWYGSGSKSDALWLGDVGGDFDPASLSVGGVYDRPFAADLNGDGRDDMVWYATGSSADRVGYASGGSGFTIRSISLPGAFQPIPGDFDGRLGVDVVWYRAGVSYDTIWWAT